MKYAIGQKVYTLVNGKLTEMYVVCRMLQEFQGAQYAQMHNYKRYKLYNRNSSFEDVRNSVEDRDEVYVFGSVEEAQKAIIGDIK